MPHAESQCKKIQPMLQCWDLNRASIFLICLQQASYKVSNCMVQEPHKSFTEKKMQCILFSLGKVF